MSAPHRRPAEALDPKRRLRLDRMIRELRETIQRGPEGPKDPKLREQQRRSA